MAAPPRVSNRIFISNIPFEQTEEQLVEIFSEVGPVDSLRLVFDRETGRPKGIAFCTYRDAETAASAKRNLHGYTVNGRALRVDFADGPDGGGDDDSRRGQGDGDGRSGADAGRARNVGMDATVDSAVRVMSVEEVRSVVQRLSPEAMLRILQTIKDLQTKSPAQAKVILDKSPALMYGMLHILVQLGLITPDMIAASLQKQTGGAPALTPGLAHGAAAGTPPAVAAAAAAAAQNPLLASLLALPPAQAAQTLQSLLALTPAQIHGMPADQQGQILQLQQLVRQGQFKM